MVVVLYLAWGAWELLLDKKLQYLPIGLDVPGWVPRGFLEWPVLSMPGTEPLPTWAVESTTVTIVAPTRRWIRRARRRSSPSSAEAAA